MEPELYLRTLYVAAMIGSIAFALSGFLAGVRRNFDLMGIFILAFLTANGGGMIRDVLVGRPPVILHSAEPFWVAGAVVLGASVFKLQRFAALERSWVFIVSDAIGLVAFGITGAMIGLESGLPFFGVVTLSFLTATGGGIIRDLLINEVPGVLHAAGGFYGSVALLLSVVIYVLNSMGLINPVTLLVVFASGLVLRLIAYRYQWRLPSL